MWSFPPVNLETLKIPSCSNSIKLSAHTFVEIALLQNKHLIGTLLYWYIITWYFSLSLIKVWLDLTWLDLHWLDSAWLDLTWLDLTWLDLICRDKFDYIIYFYLSMTQYNVIRLANVLLTIGWYVLHTLLMKSLHYF